MLKKTITALFAFSLVAVLFSCEENDLADLQIDTPDQEVTIVDDLNGLIR
ncbi:MAG: hypothetical protein ABJ004_10515 [Cyclobacteriaceae bacterium]